MREALDLVFCGTPAFAVPTLEKLAAAGHRIPLVITQPDKPRGRGLELTASPVKQSAVKLGIPVIQPERIKNNEEFRGQLSAIHPNAIVVVGYGRIIPQWMIALPALGNINLHASLLPKYRGAAPMQWAIANGETITGVTTMKIDAGLDTGDILLQREVAIGVEDTAEILAPRLASIGADLVVETLDSLRDGTIRPQPQDESQATLAPLLTKEDGLIDFSRSAAEIYNRLRGFQPWPGAYSFFRGKKLQVHSARPSRGDLQFPRASLIASGDQLFVACGHASALEIRELQIEGKKRMPARDFIHGYHPGAGEKLG